MDQDIEYVPKTNVTKLPKLWHVPGVIRFFTGRENELNLLKHHLRRPNAKIKLTGTGGVGKSQIAIKLIHDLVDEQLFSSAIMLNANSHNHDQLNVEFIELAKTLEIHIKDNPHFVQDVLNELSNRGPTLLVLDDATRLEDIQNYLPKTLSNISVIITTRDNQDWETISNQSQ